MMSAWMLAAVFTASGQTLLHNCAQGAVVLKDFGDMRTLFTQQDAWAGGWFGLNFELPQLSKRFAEEIMAELWSIPALDGCYLDSRIEGRT
jgi:hypothetical protein